MPELLITCVDAARAGGEVLRQWQGKIRAREKGPRDLVSEADFASQEEIRRLVLGRYPQHDFLGEEEAAQEKSAGESEFRWIVDPLDGTMNYVHGLANFAVSVAVEKQGRVVAGVVFDPIADECFAAEEGCGAELNGQRLHVSGCQRVEEALVAASFSSNVQRGSEEVRRFVEMLHACQGLRRMGSAALNLCYVAAGRLDAYWATSLKIWDVAAGTLILREAGGELCDIDGGPFSLEQPQLVAASSRPLRDELLAVLARAVS